MKTQILIKTSFILFLVSILLAGCVGNPIAKKTEEKIVPTPTLTATVKIDLDPTPTLTATSQNNPQLTPTTSEGISVDSKLLFVDITLPASIFGDKDMSTFDVDQYAEENGFKRAVINDDDSITITLSKSKHKEMLDAYALELNILFDAMITSEETPYITGVTPNSDFTLVVVDVDRAGYEKAFDLTPLTIGISSLLYQSIAGMEHHCEIVIRDNETQEHIVSVIYPDAFNQ